MKQRNATQNFPSWWGAMTSASFAFSGVHTNPNTEPHRDIFFIHPGTWFQKSVFGQQNARSTWTVGRNAQDLLFFFQGVFTKKIVSVGLKRSYIIPPGVSCYNPFENLPLLTSQVHLFV